MSENVDYKLELKPAVLKSGMKYRIIEITDIQFHSSKKTPTPSVGRKMQKAFEAEKPDRIYRPIEEPVITDGRGYILELLKQDPDFVKFVQAEEAKGCKVLISIPKGGIPAEYGEDTKEFLRGKNGQRILRAIAKGKRKE